MKEIGISSKVQAGCKMRLMQWLKIKRQRGQEWVAFLHAALIDTHKDALSDKNKEIVNKAILEQRKRSSRF